MSLRHHRIPLITLAALPLLLTACQEASSIAVTNRQAVSGEVTLDGEPLRAATIQFIPKGARHPVATALVVDGRFEVGPETGPPPDQYDITVISPQPDLEEVNYFAKQGKTDLLRRVDIPKKYQQPGELEVTISEGPNSNVNFSLTTP